ncbi:MAG: DUF362 domain-containing protein [Candidatus Lindowbacteria bacterium]|nr:DUF362 domain-containing protein [Candidatus Lindowbacteria bacterium]
MRTGKSTVSIVRIRDGVHEAVRKAMDLARWREFISEGAEVSLKVNLGWDLFLPGAVTGPWVVEGVIQTIRDRVSKIYVVESDQVVVNVEKALKQTGIDKVCQRYGAQWVNMTRSEFRTVPMPHGMAFREIRVPEILLRTELITIPTIKTHNKTTITGAIKNQWGCLPKLRHNYHLVLNEALADINKAATPRFAVMDATVGLEGNSPKSGEPKVVDRVLASGDFVALDTVVAKIIGFDPSRIQHIQNCHQLELGVGRLDQINVVGDDDLSLNLRFKPARHNLVSWLELALRKSFFKWLFFDTPVFPLCCWGARLWYYGWYYLVRGKRLRDNIVKNTRYGAQWR